MPVERNYEIRQDLMLGIERWQGKEAWIGWSGAFGYQLPEAADCTAHEEVGRGARLEGAGSPGGQYRSKPCATPAVGASSFAGESRRRVSGDGEPGHPCRNRPGRYGP